MMTLTQIFANGFREARKPFWNDRTRLKLLPDSTQSGLALAPFADLVDAATLSPADGTTRHSIACDISDEWIPCGLAVA